ncbi:MAG: ArsR/SmtB family transcription factor [Akkermansiaceae bacterium]
MKTYQHPEIKNVPLTAVMHALSDPCRIDIMRQLLENTELACAAIQLSVSKSTASHHFEVLRSSGLIRTRIEGVKCLNSIRIDEINQYFPGILGLIQSSNRSV